MLIKSTFVLFISACTIYPLFSYGINKCSSVLLTNSMQTSHQDVWDLLRKSKQLVNQKSIPGITDLCDTACAINIAQYITVESGRNPIVEIQHIFENFVKKHVSDNRTDSLTETVLQLKTLFKELFEKSQPTIEAIVIPDIDESPEYVKTVNSISLSDLQFGDGEVKMIISAQYSKSGSFLFVHSQIIESINGNDIRVIEPNAPYFEIIAKAIGTTTAVNNIQLPHFYYQNVLGEMHSFVVIGLITVKI